MRFHLRIPRVLERAVAAGVLAVGMLAATAALCEDLPAPQDTIFARKDGRHRYEHG